MFDFGIGSSELVIIAVVALIVIGPKDLPKVLRTIGQFTSKMRTMAREFQSHLEEVTREAGLDEVKSEVNKMTNFTVTDLDATGDEITKAIEGTSSKPASSGNGSENLMADLSGAPAGDAGANGSTKASAPQSSTTAKKKSTARKSTGTKKAATASSATAAKKTTSASKTAVAKKATTAKKATAAKKAAASEKAGRAAG